MPKKTALAFISYCHDDDDHDDGFVQQLAKRLKGEVRVQAGQGLALDVFVDRDDIQWGQDWRKRVDSGLAESAFLIPFVTPLFLDSPECCREVLKFAEIERARERSDLVLPIYYIDDPRILPAAPPTTPTTAEQAAAVIRDHQWRDWRPLRVHDWKNSDVKKMLAETAGQLRKAIERVDSAKVIDRTIVHEAPFAGEEWIVDSVGDHYARLSDVLPRCKAGDRVTIRPGIYEESALEIDRPISIRGGSKRGDVILRVSGQNGLVCSATSLVLEGFTLEHAGTVEGDGSGLVLQGCGGRLTNCAFQSNGWACAKFELGATPRVSDCDFRGGRYGMWMAGPGGPSIEACQVSGAVLAGIVCSFGASPTVRGSRVYQNGEGVWLHQGAKGVFEDNDLLGNIRASWSCHSDAQTVRRQNKEGQTV